MAVERRCRTFPCGDAAASPRRRRQPRLASPSTWICENFRQQKKRLSGFQKASPSPARHRRPLIPSHSAFVLPQSGPSSTRCWLCNSSLNVCHSVTNATLADRMYFSQSQSRNIDDGGCEGRHHLPYSLCLLRGDGGVAVPAKAREDGEDAAPLLPPQRLGLMEG